ncbi:MAG TPA: hypothetical protein VMV19_18150 [Xanthobacteraceae bacterium]|nr:hypothetical protein [Xanthobacteraceae bacterium]
MQKPKSKSRTPRRFWDFLSDEKLIDAELSTDDPEGLDNFVRELPPGDEEPYVEFKYDLRGSERERLRCVHGNHPHLAGFVMRKGDKRFLVGHICGKEIYGEDFDHYTADFNAAVNRQETLRKRREIEKLTRPFTAWLQQVAISDVFKQYESVRRQMSYRMPWIWENVPLAGHYGTTVAHVKMPPTLFLEETDSEMEFSRVVAEMSALAANLIAKDELGGKSVENLKRVLNALIRRVEVIFGQLKEVEDFFQPAVLQAVCDLANEHDKPKKRKYIAGLLTITCKRDRDKSSVQLPRNYKIPNRAGLDALKESLRVL